MSRKRSWPAFAVVGALVLAACSTGGVDTRTPAPTPEGNTAGPDDASAAIPGLTEVERGHLLDDGDTTWDVSYSDDTTLVAGEGLDALVATDRSAGTFTFDTAAIEATGLDLAEGRVLLVAGQALGRITSVRSEGAETAVDTEPASLADVIEDGTVAWDVPIEFSFDDFLTEPTDRDSRRPDGLRSNATPAVVPAATPARAQLTQISMRHPDGRIVPVRSSEGDDGDIVPELEVKPEDGSVAWTYGSQGNKYQFRLTAKGDSVDILVVVSRGGDDPTMAFRAEGSIGSLRSTSSSSYTGGELTGSDIELNDLTSNLDLSISVAAAGVSPVELEVPVPMLTYTWLVGPVPVTLDLSADIIGNVSATAQASATAKASFSYSGDAGFSFEGAGVSASGATDIGEMDPDPADSAAPMGIDVDAQFGVAFPSVSLSILGQGVVPHLHAGVVIGSRLEWGDPAAGFAASSICKSGYARMEVVGGVDLVVLGHTLAEKEHVIFEDERRGQGDGCPEDAG